MLSPLILIVLDFEITGNDRELFKVYRLDKINSLKKKCFRYISVGDFMGL